MNKKIKYETDEQLVSKIKKHKSTDAEVILLRRYMSFSSMQASQYFKTYKDHGIHHEDLFGVALEGYVIALKNYNLKKGKFNAYWRRITTNLMTKYVQDNSYFMGAKSFNGLSLDSSIDTGDSYIVVADSIGTNEDETKNKIQIEEVYKIANSEECGLTPDEKLIFFYFLDGYNVSQIMKMTGYSKTKIYNLKHRAKQKFADIYNR